jgi:hypothetical protein
VKFRFSVFSGMLVLLSSYSAKSETVQSATVARCMAIESAYTAAINSRTLARPIAIEPGWRAIEMRQIVPQYRSKLPLSAKEFEDLAAREQLYKIDHYEPHCSWKGSPIRKDGDGFRPMTVSFTNPIMSSDGHLALVEVSFSNHKGFGYGSMCVARMRGSEWSAQCIPSWIT